MTTTTGQLCSQGIDYEVVKNERRDKLDKNEFKGEQIVQIKLDKQVKNPRTDTDSRPRFLDGDFIQCNGDSDPFQQLAAWLTSASNQRFAQAQVNRIWFHLMGRGLVDPVDDFRSTNLASHPALLEALAEEFANNDFDLRHIVGIIMKSRTYQLSADANDSNADDRINLAKSQIRRLTAEQLLDAMAQVMQVYVPLSGYPPGTRASQICGVRKQRRRDGTQQAGDRFLFEFGKPERLMACECERSDETTLNQVFVLVGGDIMQHFLGQSDNRIGRLMEEQTAPIEIVRQLYWAALSRPPSSAEQSAAMNLIGLSDDTREALQDIAWALMNSKEFIFRH